MNNLENLREYILNNINENWSTIEKIRYVYVTAGKYLIKYTDFFLTINKKIKYSALSPRKLDKIYLNDLKKSDWNKVICKNASEFLKSIYDELNIDSKIIKTVEGTNYPGMKNTIYHYFLVVNDGKNNYFLTLVADLGYIQNGMQTYHFGSNVPFMVEDENGNMTKYYDQKEEIPHKILSFKEIKNIDKNIGYLTEYNHNDNTKYYYSDERLKDKNIYLDLLAKETDFYQKIMPLDENKKIINSTIDASKKDWLKLINIICDEVSKKISELTNEKYECFNITENNFDVWYNINLNKIKSEYNSREILYANPILILNKTKNVYNVINDFLNKNITISNLKNECISFKHKYISKLTELSKHFINPKYLIEPKNKDSYLDNIYFIHKFKVMFPFFFSIDGINKEKFNNLSYSEQIEIIKHMIEIIFYDLSEKNIIDSNFNEGINPIFNRIKLFTIREYDTDNFSLLINISDNNKHALSSWFIYDIKNNILNNTSLSKIAIACSKNGKYEIISERLKNIIDKIELEGEYKKR